MNKVMLSIIIPHFNSPDSLSFLLESICRENPSNTEVIVVDDGSDKYVDEYNRVKTSYCLEDRFEKILFFDNIGGCKGAGAARNMGLDKAKGKWVLFADADEWFLEGWFEKVKKYFDSSWDAIFFSQLAGMFNWRKVAIGICFLKL